MEKKKSYLKDGETWVFECRCRKCGDNHEYCGRPRNKQPWEDFMKYLSDRGINEPYIEFCEKCEAMTVQDLIAFSPRPY